MNIRPLFWMMVGAGATILGEHWIGGQLLPIPGESQQAVLAKAPVLTEPSVKTNFVYVQENPLLRTPWGVENRDPTPPFPVEEEQQDSAIPAPSLQPPPLPQDWVMSPSGQMISPEMMKSGKDPADNDPA